MLAGGALLAAGGLSATRALGAAPGSERAVLASALRLEQEAVLAYDSAVRAGELGRLTDSAELFAEHERRHAEALSLALRQLGAEPPSAPRRVEEVRGLAQALRGGAKRTARFLIGLEERSLRTYYRAQGTLRSPAPLATSAGIMANEAQHLALLRRSVGQNPSPVAFVTGRG